MTALVLVWLSSANADDATCRSPQEAITTFVEGMAPRQYDPAAAAACFDAPPDVKQSPKELAVLLQQLMDARGLVLDPDLAPSDAGYVGADGRAVYRPFTDRPELELEKSGDRWLWTRHTLRTVPRLHAETFHGLAALVQRVVPPEVGQRRLGPLQVWQAVGMLVIAAFAAGLAGLINLVLHERVRAYATRRGLPVHEDILARTQKWLVLLTIGYTLRYGVPELMLDAYWSAWLLLVARIAILVAGIAITWRWFELLAQLALDRAKKRQIQGADQLVPMARRLAQAAVGIFGAMWFLRHLGVDVDGLLAGLGIGGLALALGAQETLSNFFSSLTIFFDQPFQVGDQVIVDGVEGAVEEIGMRSTRVRTARDTLVTVPNARVASGLIENLSARRFRLVETTFGLTYDTPPERIAAFMDGLRAIAASHPGLKPQSADRVTLSTFGASSLDVTFRFSVDTTQTKQELAVRDAVYLEVLQLAARLGVAFAFPSTSVYVEKLPQASGA
jgi:MscS family membrane protein